MKKANGFTILEFTLAIALFALISLVSLPIYSFIQIKNDLNTSENTVRSGLFRALSLSRNMEGDSTWGVHIENGSVTVFKGTSYASRTTSTDEIIYILDRITTTGTLDYVFNKFTGEPMATGTITLSIGNESNNITINKKGVIQ